MRFYYISIISVLLLIVIWVVGTGLLVWLGSHLRKTRKRVWPLMVPLFLILYIGPIAEELLIARNFDRLCKENAGIFIYKTVEVEGLYDSTMRSGYENTKPGKYRFVEHASEDRKGYERVERANDQERQAALAWHATNNPDKERSTDTSIFYSLNDAQTIAVFPNGKDAWRITRLDHPMARYHYKELASHLSVTHGVKQFERVVVDQQSDDVLGRYMNYYRNAPWFFVGLDRPTIPCSETQRDTRKYGSLIYHAVLKPSN